MCMHIMNLITQDDEFSKKSKETLLDMLLLIFNHL